MTDGGRVVLEVTEAERGRLELVDRLYAAGQASLRELLDLLVDPSWVVRRQVVAALAAIGEPAVVPLRELLRARRDDESRLAAVVDALVASTGGVEDALAALLDDPAPAVVADVAQVLGRRRDPASVPALRALLRHADDNVAVAAIESLGRIGGRAAVDALVDTVSSGKFFRVYPAIDVLGRSGDPRAVAPLAALLGDAQYAHEAARALGRTGERGAISPLTQLLASPVDAAVRTAGLALADLHERHRERFGVTAALEEALRQVVAPQAHAVVRRLVHVQAVETDPSEQRALCLVLGLIGNDAAAPALTRLLDVPGVAAAAADAMRRIGRRDSEAQLLRALRDGDSARRQVLLPSIVTAAATSDVVLCLGDRDPMVRAMACDALARIGNVRAVGALFELLGDANPRVAQAATAAIQSLGSPEVEALALEAARSSRAGVRRAALRVLAYFGYPASLPVFLAASRDPDERVRDAALLGLPYLEDPAARDALLRTARDPDPRARASAARALGHCACDEQTVAVLRERLADEDAWVRYFATQALGKLSCEAAAHAIAVLLDDPAGQVRVAAVEALARLEGAEAQAALRGATSSAEPDVRRAALIGLGFGRRLDALPILLSAMASPDAVTRLVALSAIASYVTPGALPAVARGAHDPDENVRTAAIGFLAGWPGAEATEVLIDLLRDARARERALAALATPAPERVSATLAALDQADDDLAPLLTSTLARLDRQEASGLLARALASSNPAARKAAASTLAALGTRDGLAALRRAAQEDASPEVRQICALLLAG